MPAASSFSMMRSSTLPHRSSGGSAPPAPRVARLADAIDRGLRAAAFGSAGLARAYGFVVELLLCLVIGSAAAWLAVSALGALMAR